MAFDGHAVWPGIGVASPVQCEVPLMNKSHSVGGAHDGQWVSAREELLEAAAEKPSPKLAHPAESFIAASHDRALHRHRRWHGEGAGWLQAAEVAEDDSKDDAAKP